MSTTCHEMDGGQGGAERRAVRGKGRGGIYLGIPTYVYAALGCGIPHPRHRVQAHTCTRKRDIGTVSKRTRTRRIRTRDAGGTRLAGTVYAGTRRTSRAAEPPWRLCGDWPLASRVGRTVPRRNVETATYTLFSFVLLLAYYAGTVLRPFSNVSRTLNESR